MLPYRKNKAVQFCDTVRRYVYCTPSVLYLVGKVLYIRGTLGKVGQCLNVRRSPMISRPGLARHITMVQWAVPSYLLTVTVRHEKVPWLAADAVNVILASR